MILRVDNDKYIFNIKFVSTYLKELDNLIKYCTVKLYLTLMMPYNDETMINSVKIVNT